MDLQEKHQIDLAGPVVRATDRVRPWRAIIALVLSVAGAAVAAWARSSPGPAVVRYAGVAAFCVFGIAATFGLAEKARNVARPSIGSAHAGVLRYGLVLLGLFVILLVALSEAGGASSVGRVLIGGAVTGVLLGIAAQQSLANLFAGLVLLFARPFAVGDQVWIRSGALAAC